MKSFWFFCFLLLATPVMAQSSGDLSKEDSLALIEQLKEDLALLFGEQEKSFADLSVGVGTGFFQPLSSYEAKVESKAVYNISGGYYHKSGLSFDARSLFLNDTAGFSFFQAAISPSFHFTKNKKIAAGVSYTRYLFADDLSFATSPLVNEWQVYGRLKKVLLQPSLTVNYGHGIYKEEVAQDGTTPAYTYTEKASDIGVMAGIKHNFTFLDLLTKDDGLRITPSLMTIAGTSNYGMNFAVAGVANTYTQFSVNPKAKGLLKKLANGISNGNSGSGNGNGNGNNGNGNGNGNGNNGNNNGSSTGSDPFEINENYNTGFKLQSATFVLGTEYQFKKFYLQPQWLIDYSFHAVDHKWTNVFNISLGVTF